MKPLKNIRFAFGNETMNLITEMQNIMRKETGRKVSIQRVVMFYFSQGIGSNLSRRKDIVQKLFNNDQYLQGLIADFTRFDHSLEQNSNGIVQGLGVFDQELKRITTNEQLMQMDLLDQHRILRAKERNLEENRIELEKQLEIIVEKEAYWAEKDKIIKKQEIEIANLGDKLNNSAFSLQLEAQKHGFTKEQLVRLSESFEELKEEKFNLYQDLRDFKSNLKENSNQLSKIRRSTDKLVEAENSIMNKILKWATPVISYFAAHQSVKSAIKNNPELKNVAAEIIQVMKTGDKTIPNAGK